MSQSEELGRKRALLSPEKQALLQQRLKGMGANTQIRPRQAESFVAEFIASWQDPKTFNVPFAELARTGGVIANGLQLASTAGLGFSELSPGLNILALAGIRRALVDLKLFGLAGERHSMDDIIESGGILPSNQKLVRRWLMTLADEGWLVEVAGAFECAKPLQEVWPAEVESTLSGMAKGTEYEHIVRATISIGAHLASILRGDMHAAETFFSGSLKIADIAYSATREARYCISILLAIVEAIAARIPEDRPLRILEIGAGVGATTRVLLPALRQPTSYLFTDVSSYFLEEARSRFEGEAMLHFGLLDIDASPAQAGYSAGAFDVVVATNVMHCAKVLTKSLDSIKELLKPGGVFLLIETTRNEVWHQTSMGLLKGFMSFEDERLQTNLPFLSRTGWEIALRSAKFRHVASLPEDDAYVIGQHVFLAVA